MSYLIPLEVGNLDGLIVILFMLMFGPALLFIIIGFILRAYNKKKAAKVLFILAAVYVLISLGVCGGIM